MKKIVSVLLVLSIMALACPWAWAEAGVTCLYLEGPDTMELTTDATVTYTVKLRAETAMTLGGVAFGLVYDDEFLQPVSFDTLPDAVDTDENTEPPETISGMGYANFHNKSPDGESMISYSLLNSGGVEIAGTREYAIVSFTFSVLKPGVTELSLQAYSNNPLLIDYDARSIACVVDSAAELSVSGKVNLDLLETDPEQFKVSVNNRTNSALTSAGLYAAAFDVNGVMTEFYPIDNSVDIAAQTAKAYDFTLPDSGSVKFFLLESESCCPLTEAVIKMIHTIP